MALEDDVYKAALVGLFIREFSLNPYRKFANSMYHKELSNK